MANLWCGKSTTIIFNIKRLHFASFCFEWRLIFILLLSLCLSFQSDSTIASCVQYNNVVRRDYVLNISYPTGDWWPVCGFRNVSKGKSETFKSLTFANNLSGRCSTFSMQKSMATNGILMKASFLFCSSFPRIFSCLPLHSSLYQSSFILLSKTAQTKVLYIGKVLTVKEEVFLWII